MEEALHLLRSTGAPPGALGVLGQAPPPLAPKLQEEISEALLELKAEALLGYLQVGGHVWECCHGCMVVCEGTRAGTLGRGEACIREALLG